MNDSGSVSRLSRSAQEFKLGSVSKLKSSAQAVKPGSGSTFSSSAPAFNPGSGSTFRSIPYWLRQQPVRPQQGMPQQGMIPLEMPQPEMLYQPMQDQSIPYQSMLYQPMQYPPMQYPPMQSYPPMQQPPMPYQSMQYPPMQYPPMQDQSMRSQPVRQQPEMQPNKEADKSIGAKKKPSSFNKRSIGSEKLKSMPNRSEKHFNFSNETKFPSLPPVNSTSTVQLGLTKVRVVKGKLDENNPNPNDDTGEQVNCQATNSEKAVDTGIRVPDMHLGSNDMKKDTRKEESATLNWIRKRIDKFPEYLQDYVIGDGKSNNTYSDYMRRLNPEAYDKCLYESELSNKDTHQYKTFQPINDVTVYSHKVNGEERPFVEPVVVNYVNDNMPKNIKMKLSAHCIARMLERLNLNSIVDIPEWFKNHNSSVVYQDNKSSNNYLVEFTQDEDKIGFAFEINNKNAVAKTVLINKAKYGTMHNFENYDEMESDESKKIKSYLFNYNNF